MSKNAARGVHCVDLLRHGETVQEGFCGRLDTELTPQGWGKMREAARQGGPWAAIVTSPLQRCAAFAEEFACQSGLVFEREPQLAEYHFGSWEGRTAAQIWRQSPAALERFWRDPWGNPPPGAETMDAFAARVAQGWDALLRRHAERRVLLVTHAGVIRMLFLLCGRLTRRDFLAMQVKHASLHALVVPVA